LSGKCVKNCTQGFYSFRGICVACDKSCKSCATTPSQCKECADGYINANGRCVQSCSEGTFIDTVSKSCRQCALTCKSCSS
jgi:hypothetical protein